MVVRTPSFQKYSGRLVASYLSDALGTTVLLDKVRITEWIRVELQNFSVDDRQGNPLLKVASLELGTRKFTLKDRLVDIGYLRLYDGYFSLVTYSGDSATNIARVLQPLGSSSGQDTARPAPWRFEVANLHLEDMTFILRNEDRMRETQGIDYNDMEITGITLDADDLTVVSDSVAAGINYLTAKEKSGVNLKRFKGKAAVSSHRLEVRGLELEMNETQLDLDLLFTYPEYAAFNDFINQVHITSELRDCDMNLRDVGYFAPAILVMDNRILFSGKVEGMVSDFSAAPFTFALGYHTHFEGDVSLKGLPNIYSTEARLDARDLRVFPADVGNFSLPGEMRYLPVPEWADEFGIIAMDGTYSGLYNDFELDARITTNLGKLELDVQLSHPDGSDIPYYAGDLKGDSIALGSLAGVSGLGTFDIEAEIQGSGLSEKSLQAFANLWIENLNYKGHHYDRMVIGGDFTANTFAGRFLAFDEALNLSFDGLIDLSGELPAFNFYAELDKARFYDMNLSDRGQDMELKGVFMGDFIGIDPDSFSGEIRMDSVVYVENGETFKLDHLQLNRFRDAMQGDVIRLRSDYADADATGNFSIKFLLPQIRHLVLSWQGDITPDSLTWQHPQNIALDLTLKNTEHISDLFMEDLRVANGARISGYFNSSGPDLNVTGDLDFISFRGLRFEQVSFNNYSTASGVNLEAFARYFYFNKTAASDTVSNLGIENFDVFVGASGDSLGYAFSWDDSASADENKGRLEGWLKVPEEGRLVASLTASDATVNGSKWTISPDNYVVIDSNYLEFSNLRFIGQKEQFLIDGVLSRQVNDTLRLSFDNWSIDNFSPVYTPLGLQMEGKLEGNIGYTYREEAPSIFSNLIIDSLEFNNTLLGQARIRSNWIDDNKSVVVNIQILPPGLDGSYKVLNINGFVFPLDTANNFDLDIVTQNLQLSVLSPFLSSFSSGLKGLASGQVHMGGTFNAPVFEGKIKLQRTELRIDYLNVTYTLSNEITFTEDAISFQDIEIYDRFTNRGVVSGALKHDHFRDMYLDLRLKPDNLLALNLGRYDNDIFYGTAFATGDVRIYGPFQDISIDLDVITGKGTDFYIPLNYSVDVSQSDFIVFIDRADSTAIQEDYRVVVQGFKLNLGIGVRPAANLQIFLPSDMGSIKASGEGDIRIGVDPRGYLTINGSYFITSGLFTFSLEQLVSKRFEIVQGSNIKWEGDINSAEVDIAANYRTKTSLSGLGITMLDPSDANKKVNVVVKIFMTENLFNPNLRFSVDFPNLDEQTKQTVYAVLDTSDMALMNQQAISLLILNSFTYAGNTGSNPINSTAIIANSLSNMLSSISRSFDIGINYIPGDDVSDEEVEVALSTQLFDDRLLIDGNFGVPTDNSSQNTSSIVGDVQVEYKLTSDGRLRVKAFNRANDISIIENDVPYTQGVGIFYRRDFDSLRELFTPSKRKEKRNKND